MMKHTKIPWLTLNTSPDNNLTDNDAEGSIDGNSMDVTQAMDCMMLDEGSDSDQCSHRVGELKPSKRKRTSSQASPPKVSHLFIPVALIINMHQKDGGRGPIKRRKETDNEAIQSASPVQPASDIDDFGLIDSPVGTHASPISNISSPYHDTSLIEAWDDVTSNNALRTQANEPTFHSDDEQWKSDDDDDQRDIPEVIPQVPSSYNPPLASHSASFVDVPPEGAIVLVPDSQSSPPPKPRKSTPSGPPLDYLAARGDISHCSNVPSEASSVAGRAPCREEARTDTITHSSSQDGYEVSMSHLS